MKLQSTTNGSHIFSERHVHLKRANPLCAFFLKWLLAWFDVFFDKCTMTHHVTSLLVTKHSDIDVVVQVGISKDITSEKTN